MKPINRLKPKAAPGGQMRRNTKDSLLRWLEYQGALEKLAAEKQTAESAYDMKRALMVWVDEGGRPA